MNNVLIFPHTWSFMFSSVLGVLLILHMATSSKLVCHMTNWAQYRPGMAKFTSDNIDPFLCTHVVYALVTINSFNQITPIEWNDEQQFVQLNNLKHVNPALKTLLTVGGTVNGLSPYISVVSRPENRAAFIKSVINYLRTHNFDGLNVHWDYPGQTEAPCQTARELAKAFESEAKDTRKTPLLLSAEVAVNVLKTYDYHGSWEARTGHNSPVYRSSVDPGSQIYHNINASISHWLNLGAPAEKLLLGFPTFGRTFRLSSGANGLGAPANGPAEPGPYTRTAGFWSFYEVCGFTPGASVEWISEQEVPYATFGSAWVGYDDQRSFSHKVQYMTAHNLGGAHVWTLDMDDFSGSFCGSGAYPLVNHLRMSMGFGPKPTTTPAPTTTRDPVADFCSGRPNGLYVNVADRTTYFQCFQGNTYLHSCQPGLIFYDSCKCCNWP
uniref:chitinase n=1 Tax=Neogobius melanostomus TaxID=47308 RepID=A0A8C6UU95_9GOBI